MLHVFSACYHILRFFQFRSATCILSCSCDFNKPNKYFVHNCDYLNLFKKTLFNPYLFYTNELLKTRSNRLLVWGIQLELAANIFKVFSNNNIPMFILSIGTVFWPLPLMAWLSVSSLYFLYIRLTFFSDLDITSLSLTSESKWV